MKKPIKILLSVLFVIFACVFVFSGYKLYTILHGYKVAENLYDGISSKYVTTAEAKEEQTDPLKDEEKSPISVDFPSMLEQNPDVAGWLFSADTAINYPVAIGEDNFFYLHRLIDGSYNSSGTLFIDCLCERDFSGKNTLIYGHHMNDGSMFASIRDYSSQEYYDAHPKMYLNTPDQNYRVELFAGYITDADSDTYTIGFPSGEAYLEYLNKMRSQSEFKSDVELTADDRIVTLSTCTYEYYDARYVVQGKLVPIN